MKEFIRMLGELKYMIPVLRYQWPQADENASLSHSFQESTNKFGERPFVYFEEETWTYSEANKAANSFARYLSSNGVKHGDKVVLFMENRPYYAISLLALNKIGAIGVLINTSLTGDPLIHCINSSNSVKCIVGAERAQPLQEVLEDINISNKDDFLWVEDTNEYALPEWAINLKANLDFDDNENLDQTNKVTAKDVACYIFTSGTTGVPKAAILPNAKLVAAATNITMAGYRINHEDCMYNCLPLYHSTGLMLGLCAAINVGAASFIKRKFSASSFWQEANEFNTTAFVYIGELCRYLINKEPSEAELNNPIVSMVGNGLRPDVWDTFKERFDIDRIIEIYGASEGNALFMNLFNKNKTIGMTSAEVALLEYDVAEDEILKNDEGFCKKITNHDPGLLIVEIGPNAVFNGYTDKEASEKKILRDVFKVGDAWFNTGDLIKTVDVGFAFGKEHYQFVDRVGDTFRWRSENVSTNEVGEILNGYKDVNMANVYGVKVPGCEGRAGMAAFSLEDFEGFNWLEFSEYVENNLPKYARPIFIRIIQEMDTTGTFKLKKNELRDDAFNISKVEDKVFCLKPSSNIYELLDGNWLDKINSEEAGY
ncbi:MAG: long-chain-acyl-CoA synthetase [SAR86 cluster bacterium]|uniref:Long-chain-acyl-CoA synthetase n=1 Tax=SAR86 cluster bacterium TaxID=2030880 RepID=A0A368C4F8_9GAMM|nr:MAG: long-chain-acyl-CoA synthetase [SAR86 cluster bacterium]